MSNTLQKRNLGIAPSQNAMLGHFAYLLNCEHRAACWLDFLDFIVDGKRYLLKRGTIRNNLSYLCRLGMIEFTYRSNNSYYTLPGEGYQKTSSMTLNHARVHKHDLAAIIERMAFDTPAAHDIHLRFNSEMIWDTLSVLASPSSFSSISTNLVDTLSPISPDRASLTLSTRRISKDLVLPVMTLDSQIKGMVTVHKSDTVSIILSCSETPIRFDIGGLVTLSSSLARIEERLAWLIDIAQRGKMLSIAAPPCSAANTAATTMKPATQSDRNYTFAKKRLSLPEYGSWIVTMWHVGRDSIERYTGEKFEVAWEDFTGEWIRVYSKKRKMIGKSHSSNGKKSTTSCILRIERQEYPKQRLRSAVEQKLSMLYAPTIRSPYDS
jgi:hypothetical protein